MANDSKLYEVIGLGKLLSGEYHDKLKKHIRDNVDYIVPGYRYDYLHCGFKGYIETYYPRNAVDNQAVDCDVNIHYCGNTISAYEIMADGDIDDPRPIIFCRMNGYTSDVPVFFENADVLPDLRKGRSGTGQLVAFAEKIEETEDQEICAEAIDCEKVRLTGKITHVSWRSFSFENISVEFCEIIVSSVFGNLEILYTGNKKEIKPEKDTMITCDCYLSLDVALSQQDDGYLHFVAGKGVQEEKKSGVKYIPVKVRKNGFRIDDDAYLDAVREAVRCKDMKRLKRCCKTKMFVKQGKDQKTPGRSSALSGLLKWFEDYENLSASMIIAAVDPSLPGRKCLLGRKADGSVRYLCLSFTDDGFIYEFCSDTADESMRFGEDQELYMTACIGRGLSDNRLEIFDRIINKDCCYTSFPAGVSFCTVRKAYEHNNSVNASVRKAGKARYTYIISRSADELIDPVNAPVICRQRKWCVVLFYNGVNSIVFLDFNAKCQVNQILVTCDGEYLHRFGKSELDLPALIQTGFDSMETLRTQDSEELRKEVQAWKETDRFVCGFLNQDGFYMAEDDIEMVGEDCLIYQRSYKCKKYEFYAFVSESKADKLPDADRFRKNRESAKNHGREARLMFIKINNQIDNKQDTVVSNWDGNDCIDVYRLQELNHRTEYVFVPKNKVQELNERLCQAVAENDYDGIAATILRIPGYGVRHLKKMLRDGETVGKIDNEYDEGLLEKNGCVYQNTFLCKNLLSDTDCGRKLHFAYVCWNSQIYSLLPYVEGKCIFTITVDNYYWMIREINEDPWNETWKDFIPVEMPYEYHTVPRINAVKFNDMFEIEADFENGEKRVYALKAERSDVENTYMINNKVLTLKMLRNGRITEQTTHHEFFEKEKTIYGKQGVEFINGITVSAAEIYYNGLPSVIQYENESLMPVDDYDFEGDNYTVSTIIKGYTALKYLFNRKSLVARVLPMEYQDTDIYVYPPCGGYQDGLIMVNTFSDVCNSNLEYFHNRATCVGCWGWIDTDFNVRIFPQYAFAMQYFHGRAIVCRGTWETKEVDGNMRYWCPDEHWGMIDKDNKEIIPCAFDELFEINGSDNLYFIHTGGWKNGHYAVYDIVSGCIILDLDFDFDMAYMFNDCHVTEDNLLVFDEHVPGKEKEIVTVFDLKKREYLIHTEETEGKALNGETRVVVNRDGKDIIVF